MSKLTTKQEKYVQGLIAGLSQRKAYRAAYPNTKEWKNSSVDSQASRLLATNKVLTRYNELLDEHKNKALWTREKAVNELIWLMEKAKESIEQHDEGYTSTPPVNAFINAVRELNKIELVYPVEQMEAKKLEVDLDVNSDKTVNIVADIPNVIGDSDE